MLTVNVMVSPTKYGPTEGSVAIESWMGTSSIPAIAVPRPVPRPEVQKTISSEPSNLDGMAVSLG